MSSGTDTKADNLLAKRPAPSWLTLPNSVDSYNRLENLYQLHMCNLSKPENLSHQKLQKSFENYITFVYDLLKLGPIPEGFECFASHTSSLKSLLTPQESTSIASVYPPTLHPTHNPVEPKPTSLEEMTHVVQQSSDMQIFRTVMLKIMCDEPITLADLTLFSESKLFNLKKLVFIKFKRVLDTE